MITQLGAVRGGGNRFRRNQVAEVQARMGLLPSIIQAKYNKAAEVRAIQEANKQKQLMKKYNKYIKRNARFQQKQERAGLGLEAIGLGANILTSDIGSKTINSLWSKQKEEPTPISTFKIPTTNRNVWGPRKSSGITAVPTAKNKPSNMLSNLNFGSILGGGLAGFGASRLAGKNKLKKAGLGLLGGALAGGIGSYMNSNRFSLGNTLAGGLTGLLGGLF